MARDLILHRQPGAEVTLRRTGGGVFEITVDGRLAWSKKAVGRFPMPNEVLEVVSEKG